MTVATKQAKMGMGVGFERIRRITGYLVGTMDKWNNAKKAEERDRVKHSLQGYNSYGKYPEKNFFNKD